MKNMKLALLAMGLMAFSVGMAETELEKLQKENSELKSELAMEKRITELTGETGITIARLEGGLSGAMAGVFIGASLMPVTGSVLIGSMPILAVLATEGYMKRTIADGIFEENLPNDLGYESEIKARKVRDALEKDIFDAAQF